MTPEHALMNEARLWLGERGYLVFRTNVGTWLGADGAYHSTGLPAGFPDLLALDDRGHAFFIECKVRPYRPSKEQLAFIAEARRRGFAAGVCYSVADVEALAEEAAAL